MSTAASQPLDQAKLHEFVMRAVGEMGAAMNAAFIVIALLGLSSGTVGVAGLVIGCATMVKETRLAVENLAKEATAAGRHGDEEKSPTTATFGVPASN